jgi:hypothetical protein
MWSVVRRTLCPAKELLEYCNKLVKASLSAVPPEVLVFRGNAYCALGQPCFALADYRAAAAAMPLSGTHETRALGAIATATADELFGCEGSDDHLTTSVTPYLSPCVGVAPVPHCGRGVVAKETVEPGTVIVRRCEPFLRYPLHDGLCSRCSGPLPRHPAPCRHRDCAEEYCTPSCRTAAAAEYHAPVCRNGDFQRLELELFAHFRAAPTATEANMAAAHLVMLRLAGLALSAGVSSLAELRQVQTLSGRLHYTPRVIVDGTLSFHSRLRRVTGLNGEGFECFVRVLAKVVSNLFHDSEAVTGVPIGE